MAEIPFTQYVLPDGRQKPVSIEVACDVAEKAASIIASGLRFECEILRTGHVSLTIHDPDEGDDVAIKVLPNGPGITEAVEAMVRGFKPVTPAGEEAA